MTKLIPIFLICICAGCMTNPTVEVVKPWEGHCYTVQEVKDKIDNMQLDENESVWILSNRTLKRVLKNNAK